MKVKGEINGDLDGYNTELLGSTRGLYCMMGNYYIYFQTQKCKYTIDILGTTINDGSKTEDLLKVTSNQPKATTTEKNIGPDQGKNNAKGNRSDIGLSMLVTSVFWSSFV